MFTYACQYSTLTIMVKYNTIISVALFCLILYVILQYFKILVHYKGISLSCIDCMWMNNNKRTQFDLVSVFSLFCSLCRHVTTSWNCFIFSLFSKWSSLPLSYRLYSTQKLIIWIPGQARHLGILVSQDAVLSNSDKFFPFEMKWRGMCNVFNKIMVI